MVLVQTPLPKLFTVNNKYKSVPKMFSAERRQTHQSHLQRVGGGGGKSQRGFLEEQASCSHVPVHWLHLPRYANDGAWQEVVELLKQFPDVGLVLEV